MSVAAEPHTRADKRLHQPAPDPRASSPRCRCSTATLSSPAGDNVVLRVAGEVDLDGFAGLDAALDDVLDRRPDHLIVDLTGLVFCSFQGLAAITRTARAAAANGTRYSMSGAALLIARLWPNYRPNGDAPPSTRPPPPRCSPPSCCRPNSGNRRNLLRTAGSGVRRRAHETSCRRVSWLPGRPR
jgi:hypothetical protein